MRHRPPPLLRLSPGAGLNDPATKDDDDYVASAIEPFAPSIRTPSVSQVSPYQYQQHYSHTHSPTSHPRDHSPALPTYSRPQHTAPLFPLPASMFRIGTSRSKSPRRVASTIYAHQTSSAVGNPASPASMAISDHAQPQRPFSSWGSTDSQSSTSPRNSTKLPRGQLKQRAHSPTTSVSTAATTITKSSRGFLGRGRKQSTSGLDSEFDPTTFRKNRTRPNLGVKGEDALYHGYEDLFDDSLEDHALDADASQTDEGGEDEDDGFFLLQIEEHPERTTSLENSPHISPKTRRPSDGPPRSVPAHYAAGRMTPPPAPPPKSWRRSIVTTTPPRSTHPSVESFDAPTTAIAAPPTPPPKADADAAFNAVANTLASDEQATSASAPATSSSPGPPPHRPPPPTPPPRASRRRLSRLSIMSNKRPRSIPEGLGIINIPSPTLFSGFSGGADDTWGELSAHASKSPALTNVSFTPRQFTFGSSLQDEPTMRQSLLKDGDGAHSDPGEGAADEMVVPLNIRKISRQWLDGSEAGTIKVKLEVEEDSDPGNASSAVTENSVETLLDNMMSDQSAHEDDGTHALRPATASSGERAEDYDDALSSDSGIEVNDEKIPVETQGRNSTDSQTRQVKSDKEESEEKNEDDGKLDVAYLKAFRAFLKASGDNDPFVQRGPRFDAVQAQRVCSYLRKDSATEATTTKGKDRPRRNSKVRQHEAGEEILTNLWALMSARWLSFGRIITSPAHDTLLMASAKRLTRRATIKQDRRATQMLASAAESAKRSSSENLDQERRRVLDLGGQPVADWGWHCASDYPKVKVYTVTQRSHQKRSSSTQSSPLNATPSTPTSQQFRGPKNHRHLAVDRLYKLPFPANHFDVVSARSLFLNLKVQSPSRSPGQLLDEYDRCLEECIRILKPGGYLEFFVIDSDIINPGPSGAKLSSRFSEQLRSRGYDPKPTRRFVSRLNKAGFDEIRRAWMFMPMAPPSMKPKVPSKSDLTNINDSQEMDVMKEEMRRKMEAWEDLGVQKGSLADVAPVSGLTSGWAWEKWMAVAGIRGEEATIGGIMEEGKEMKSGWRSLTGWARKPLA